MKVKDISDFEENHIYTVNLYNNVYYFKFKFFEFDNLYYYWEIVNDNFNENIFISFPFLFSVGNFYKADIKDIIDLLPENHPDKINHIRKEKIKKLLILK